MLCVLVGALFVLIYGFQLLFLAFEASIWWGLAYLFIPLAALVFLLLHWQDAKGPFVRKMFGLGLALLGFYWMEGKWPDFAR